MSKLVTGPTSDWPVKVSLSSNTNPLVKFGQSLLFYFTYIAKKFGLNATNRAVKGSKALVL